MLDHWPINEIFPILHIICANVAREGMTKCQMLKIFKLMRKFHLLASDSPSARMCLRIIANCFSNETCCLNMMDLIDQFIPLFEDIMNITKTENEMSVQVFN